MKFSFGGLVLIVFGALVLARNLGFLNISIAELIGTWWPLGLIVLGAGFFFAPDGNDRKRYRSRSRATYCGSPASLGDRAFLRPPTPLLRRKSTRSYRTMRDLAPT